MSDIQSNPSNLSYVEGLYAEYLSDRSRVPREWQTYFDALGRGRADPPRVGPRFTPSSIFNPPALSTNGRNGHAAAATESDIASLQDRVDQLVRNYRIRGHLIAAIDPLGESKSLPPELDYRTYRFTEGDLDRPFSTTLIAGAETRTLREILAILFNTYCRSIGSQFMHIDDLHMRQWLQNRMESSENHLSLTRDEQLRILMRLTDAFIFEDFLRKKYGQKKSFSLQGGESLIPLLDLAIERAAELGVVEIVMAMAHRGRLNVLTNIMGKNPFKIFREFEDKDPELHIGRGDVKYHLGASADLKTAGGKNIHLSLCFNPSHLEFVNPVALGRMRAKQDRYCSDERRKGITLLIHGDAAFAGEGVTQETLNLSELSDYSTGGTLHVIVNNQIGYTTPPEQGRSSTYATDVAKMLNIPIFHVNGEDPEAVAQVVNLALEFRQKFQRDVVIDMYCYRRLGHNEGDEPAFTQPLLYQQIEQRKSVREGYIEHLLKLGGVSREEADKLATVRRDHLDRDLSKARSDESKPTASESLDGLWSKFVGGTEPKSPDVETGVDVKRLSELLAQMATVPADFTPHPKLAKGFLADRTKMARGEQPLDWAACEALAMATLAAEGHPIRLTGQDSERGTFGNRHAVLHDWTNDRRHCPLQHVAPNQAKVHIANSPLSEIAVLGFEYGYSLDCPDGLVMWEAQFGDFVNVAQVIIDQFIASGEEKWNRLSGLVLLLPHGMEGQGPEHSSARLERFLALCASDNMQVAYPSTAAQYFHLLRRQVLRPWRKPLVVMTPKGGLRAWVSPLDEMGAGTRFRRVIPDARADASKTTQVLLCTGKVYHELARRRDESGRSDVAIVRIEQLYPLPVDALREALAAYAKGTPVAWVQEEPQNMGAWRTLYTYFGPMLLDLHPFTCVCRPPAASPATGSHASHVIEQEELLAEAFGAAAKRPRWRS